MKSMLLVRSTPSAHVSKAENFTPVFRCLLAVAIATLGLTSCTVWTTEDTRHTVQQSDGTIREEDQSLRRDGQPYFLPKGIVHLTVQPESPPKVDNSQQQAPIKGVFDTQSGVPQALPIRQAYKATADVALVADRSRGPYYAHYRPNWLYDDLTAVKIDHDLLTSLSATVTDRTKESLDNLADAAANVAKFEAAGGLGALGVTGIPLAAGGKEPKSKITRLPLPYVKQISIDVTFDPLVREDRERITHLFSDDPSSPHPIYSPLVAEIRVREAHMPELAAREGRHSGLWFREPTTVEIIIRQNTALTGYLKKLLHDSDKRFKILSAEKDEAAQSYSNTEAAAKKDLKDETKAAAMNAAAKASTEATGEVDIESKYRQAAESLYYGALLGEQSRDARISLSVPNKDRAYSVNIPRSAFVSRTTKLTIDHGVLQSIDHNKPSEFLGFTAIPKSITEKLAALPKAILETKKDTLASQQGVLSARQGVINQDIELQKQQGTRHAVVQTSILDAQKGLTQKKVEVLQSNNALTDAQQKTLVEQEAQKLQEQKALDDARTAAFQSETARLQAEKANFDAQTALDQAKKKAAPGASASPTAVGPSQTLDPSKPPGQQ